MVLLPFHHFGAKAYEDVCKSTSQRAKLIACRAVSALTIRSEEEAPLGNNKQQLRPYRCHLFAFRCETCKRDTTSNVLNLVRPPS